MSARLSVFLPSLPVGIDTAERLEAMARAEGKTMTAYIRQVLADHTRYYLEVIETDD